MSSWLNRIRVVLCRPEGGLNVGSVCRAMKTMGLTHLFMTSPAPMDRNEIYKMALHARDVYEDTVITKDLEEALEGVSLAAGVTRRRGVRRKWFSLLPEEFAERAASLKSGVTALVFGNEKDGLTIKELACCHVAVHIPSSPDFPSLNLSHAVQLLSSALWRRALEGREGGYNPVNHEEIDHIVGVIHETLEALGYFEKADGFHTDTFFRDILARAALSTKESQHLERFFRNIQYLKVPGMEE